jgi:hypothetical protein
LSFIAVGRWIESTRQNQERELFVQQHLWVLAELNLRAHACMVRQEMVMALIKNQEICWLLQSFQAILENANL